MVIGIKKEHRDWVPNPDYDEYMKVSQANIAFS